MNYARIALAGIAAWLASIVLGYLINDVWLLHLYQANAWAFRHPEDIAPPLADWARRAAGRMPGLRVRVREGLRRRRIAHR